MAIEKKRVFITEETYIYRRKSVSLRFLNQLL